ncbi:MAG: hypothetical protein Q8Q94_04565, partial [bacterium]|nr:hypothetical protein [bacterium]MDZ4299615.1 hypothetical protein [Candidatus Sungbacteria bacterium]
ADINRLSTGRLPMYISRSRNQNNYSFFQVSPPKLSAFTCLDKPDHLRGGAFFAVCIVVFRLLT